MKVDEITKFYHQLRRDAEYRKEMALPYNPASASWATGFNA